MGFGMELAVLPDEVPEDIYGCIVNTSSVFKVNKLRFLSPS